jgi:tRNA dimethylallyltransferase
MSTYPAPIPVIFGPTASGKTALALALAQALAPHHKAEIINADSRQVYRGLPILTACPTAAEYAQTPHHLFEFLAPTERFSAAQWATMANAKIAEIQARSAIPIIVGGTGFYLRALMGGLSQIPASNPIIEAAVAALPAATRHAELAAADPQTAAKLHPNDTQRTTRALTVFRQTGQPLSRWQQGGTAQSHTFLKIALNPPRATLHANIAHRWQHTLPARGLWEEVQRLAAQGLTGAEPALKGLAIPAWLAAARGEITRAEATQKAIWADNQYAKRQATWLKNSYGATLTLESADLHSILHLLQP